MTLPLTTAVRESDGEAYTLNEYGYWIPVQYHCVDCLEDSVVKSTEFGPFKVIAVPVEQASTEVIDRARRRLDDLTDSMPFGWSGTLSGDPEIIADLVIALQAERLKSKDLFEQALEYKRKLSERA